MITPRFNIEQDSDYLMIEIHAPYCDLQELDVDIENENFMFYCKPYFLRLNLPGKVKDSDSSCGKFDVDMQKFNFKIEKFIRGELFSDLDMITKLLQPKLNKNKQGCIEVLSSDNPFGAEDGESEDHSDSEQWYFKQEYPKMDCSLLNQGYGFANKITTYLNNTPENYLFGVLEDISAIKMSLEDRRKERLQFETASFDKDIYLYQYFHDEDIDDIIDFPSPWSNIQADKLTYTEYEFDILKELPNKEYLLSPNEENHVLMGLVDILFAYCYDKRTFAFENNAESGWATNKISSALSWFDVFETVNETLDAGFRRSLCFPLYRNFKLSTKLVDDLRIIFRLGRKFILKCLLEIHQWFNMGTCTDPRYILNDLFIKDYCIYIQKCNSTKLNNILSELEGIKIYKHQLKLNLADIEQEAIDELLNSDEDSSSSSDSSSCDSDDDSSSTDDSSDDQTSDTEEEAVDNLTKNLDSLNFKSNE